MFLGIVFLLFLFYLSIKNRFYLFSILPIFLLLNYLFFFLITTSNLIKNPFLDIIFTLYKLDTIYDFNFQLLNTITYRTGLFYSLILLFSYILSNQILIKKVSSNLLKILFFYLGKLSSSTKKRNLPYNSINQIAFTLILVHAFSFYTAENVMFHREYLSILKSEFYYFYPFLSIVISKILIILLFPMYFISKYLYEGIKGLREIKTIFIFAHSLIYLSALNSRWLTIYILVFTFFTSFKLITNKNTNLLNKFLQSATIFFIGTFSALFCFQKVIFYRNQLSGIGTVFQFNSFEFTPLESLSSLFISFFTAFLFRSNKRYKNFFGICINKL